MRCFEPFLGFGGLCWCGIVLLGARRQASKKGGAPRVGVTRGVSRHRLPAVTLRGQSMYGIDNTSEGNNAPDQPTYLERVTTMTKTNNKALHEAFAAFAKAVAAQSAKEVAYSNAKEKTAATVAALRDIDVQPSDIKAPDNAGKNQGVHYAALESAIVATLSTAQQNAFALPKSDPDMTERDKKARRDARKVVSSRIRRLRDALSEKAGFRKRGPGFL